MTQKVEPKNGEWWLCSLGKKRTMALNFKHGAWVQDPDAFNPILAPVTPLHRLFIQGTMAVTIEKAEDVISQIQSIRERYKDIPAVAISREEALWLVAGEMLDQAQGEIDSLRSLARKGRDGVSYKVEKTTYSEGGDSRVRFVGEMVDSLNEAVEIRTTAIKEANDLKECASFNIVVEV